MTDAATLEKPSDVGQGPAAVVARWMREWDLASESEKKWREDAERVIRRYRGESKLGSDGSVLDSNKAESYNLLYSNVETISPILYNSTPEPVVERRFDNDDPLAKAASEVLRRAIKYAVGCQDFDEVISLAVKDYQLPGRAVVSVQYVPTMAPVEEGTKDQDQAAQSLGAQATEGGDPQQAKTEELVYEEIRFDLTPWRGFRRGPGRTWQDVPWIGYELDLSRESCIELFGDEIGKEVPLRSMTQGDDKKQKDDEAKEQLFARAKVYLIRDKNARKVLWICPDYAKGPCKEQGDEYNLSGFFNCPRPLYAIETSDSLVPVPEFNLYKTLADEAETIVNRMAKIMRMIRVRYAFDANMPELEKMLESPEGQGTPVKNANEWREKGGVAGGIWMWPIDVLMTTYAALAQQLDRIKGEIFEILGVADIMRGATDPDETMGAQAIKERWGSLRTRRRQAEVQRFCRDLFRLAGELIAEKFQPQTLQAMTGLPYLFAAEKQQLQQVAQMAQQNPQMAQSIPPAIMAKKPLLDQPTWEDIVGFLRNDAMRHLRIDIQTDSTIALQEGEDQADFAKMMTAVGQMVGEVMPLVSQGILPFDAAKAMLLGLVRKFRLGYDVEDKLAQMTQPQPPDPSKSPDMMKAQAKGAADKEVATVKAQASIAIEQARADADIKIQANESETKTQLAAHKAILDAQSKAMQALPQLISGIIIQELKNVGALGVARVTAGLDAGQSLLDHEMALAEQQQAAELQPARPQ